MLLNVCSLLSSLLRIFVSNSECEQMSLAIVVAFILNTVINQLVGHQVEATACTDYHHKHCNLNDEKADEMEKHHYYYRNTFLSVKNHVHQLKGQNKAVKAADNVGSGSFELK